MEVTINGKRVVLRERFPTREYDQLRQQFMAIDADTPWDKRANTLRAFVESWEFDGDPDDVEAWGDLDLFLETIPLELAISERVLARYNAAKNSESGSTTP